MSAPAIARQIRNPQALWPAFVLGVYAAGVAIAPTWTAKLILASPLIVIPFAFWTVSTPTRWMSVFLCAALLLPPLPIALGDSGPHPALAIAALGLFAGVARLRDWRIRIDPVTLPLLCFFVILLASAAPAAWYSGVPLAAVTIARVFLFGISVYVYLYASSGPGASSAQSPSPRLIFYAAAGSALFAILDFYFQFPAPAGFGPQFVWMTTGVFRRAQGLFYEASTLGNLCAFFLLMVATALFRPFGSPVRRVLYTGAALFSMALVLSYSRASLVNVALGFAALLWLHRGRVRIGRILTGGLVCLAVAAALGYIFFPTFVDFWLLRLRTTSEFFTANNEGVLSGRLESWRMVADFLLDNPIHALVGVGYKTLPYSDVLGRPVVADNMYLSLLAETGLPGLGALLWLNVAILRMTYRSAHSADSRAAFFGAWVFAFWIGQMAQMLSGDLLTYWRVLPVYFWAAAQARPR